MTVNIIARVKADWDYEFERHQNNIPEPAIPELPELPAGRYVDQAFYDLEQKHFWNKVWILAGHTDELPEPGSYRLWKGAGQPILLVRGKDDRIRAFYNTCRHRGGRLVKDECGKTTMLSCQFHSWSYDLTGKLRNVPCEHEFPGLNKENKGLVEVRCELWGNLIYINRNPDAEPLLDYLGPMVENFRPFDLGNIKLIQKVSKDIRCNWKVLIDAFQETYHFKAVHPQTIDLMLDNRRPSYALYKNGHSRLIMAKRTDTNLEAQVLDRGRSSGSDEHALTREAACTYTVFPNIIAAAAEFQWPLMVYWPTGLNTSRLEIYYLAPPGHEDPQSQECQEVMGAFDYVTIEDMSNLEDVQASMESEAFSSIRLGSMERRIYQHHEVIDQYIGQGNIPEHYRIPQILADLEEDRA